MNSNIPNIGSLFIPRNRNRRFILKLILFLFFALLVILGGFGVNPF